MNEFIFLEKLKESNAFFFIYSFIKLFTPILFKYKINYKVKDKKKIIIINVK